MPQIGDKGEELDLLIRQGGTFGPHEVSWTNPDGTFVDISDMFFRAQIRKDPTDDDPVATFICKTTNAIQGKFSFEIDATQTANIPSGPDENQTSSAYFWDLEAVTDTGVVIPLIYGKVKMFREITK